MMTTNLRDATLADSLATLPPDSIAEQSRPTIEAVSVAAARSGLDLLAKRLVEMRSWLADDMVVLERELASCRPEADDLAAQAGRYLLERPGKRIRPVCVALAARLGGHGFDEPVQNIAVAAELIHAATLLHDDVIDDGDTRRGAPSARVVLGNGASVLGGDLLLLEALRRVRSTQRPELLGRVIDVIDVMVSAEALQLERRGRFAPSRETYMEVALGKTASLFAWSLLAGGTIAGLDDEQLDALSTVGESLGLAFQLVDDVIDLESDSPETGKDALADLREGKLTWPLVLASERDPAVKAALHAIAAEEVELTDEAAASLQSRILATGATSDTRAEAGLHAERAKTALHVLPDTPARRALETIVDASIGRTA